MKKKIVFALSSIALLCFNYVALASDGRPAAKTPPVAKTSSCKPAPVSNNPTVVNLPSPQKNYYVGLEMNAYYLRLPGFDLPLTDADGPLLHSNSGNFQDPEPINFSDVTHNKMAVMPTFEFGYKFQNPGILPQIFGDDTSVALKFGFENLSTDNASGPNDDMDLYDLYGNKLNGGTGTVPSTSTTLHTDISLYNLSLLFKGKKTNELGDVTYTPYAGVVYSHLKDNNNFSIAFQGSSGGTTYFDNTKENVSTDYIGVGAGTKVAIKINQNFDAYADAMMQLLYAHSSANASMVIPGGTGPIYNGPETASSTLSAITYRGILSVGSDYYVDGLDDPNSTILTLGVGMEQWGFLPKVMNPHSPGEVFHLDSSSKLSTFIHLGVNVPIA